MRLNGSSVFVLAMTAAFALNGAEYRVSGPQTYQNLSVFLIHGANQPGASRKFLTLQEALQQHKVVVYETGSVNQLAIENVSQDEDVYIQSGEIVKGGQQDRTLKDDFILPTKSGKVPIASFCVEHGRWSRRGQEAVRNFESAPQAVAAKQVKMAMRMASDQQQVWNEVSRAQDKLSGVAGSVRAAASPTSYMLSLESPRLQQSVDNYIRDLAAAPNGSTDVIGYAFAVNGKINSAEVYASNELFRKLWPKLLRASAVEAVSNFEPGLKFEKPSFDAVRASLQDADHGRSTTRQVNSRTSVVTKETERNVVFETRDQAQGGWVHRSYITK
ncbi:MAG: hypothetical protein M3Y27_02875 [Acidobacteriota bacterium]|nr:hypothetical protein [Acidobacteriota bacterium]